MVCEYFKNEAEAAVEIEKLEDVAVLTFSAVCGQPSIDCDFLAQTVHDCEKEWDRIYMLGGSCLPKRTDLPERFKRTCLYTMNQCFHMFMNKNYIDECLKEGAYLLTPGLVKHWNMRIKNMGFEQNEAREFFRESCTKLVMIDTGLDDRSMENLKKFAEFIDLPFRKVSAGLDFFCIFLRKLVMERRFKIE
jgi:hypothetical protein